MSRDLRGKLCTDDRHVDRETRNTITTYDGEMTPKGPFDGNAVEFKEFEEKVLKKNSGSLNWMCEDNALVRYVRNNILLKIEDNRNDFGVCLATIPATKTTKNPDAEEVDTCDQPLAFILYRDTMVGDTRFVHVDLVCRGRNGKDSSAFVSGRTLYQYAEDAIVESTSDGVARVQFSLDSIDTAIQIYKKWGYSTINYANDYDNRVYNEMTEAMPMVKVLERTVDEKMRAFMIKGFVFIPVDGGTHAFRVNREKVDFGNSNYGRVDVTTR